MQATLVPVTTDQSVSLCVYVDDPDKQTDTITLDDRAYSVSDTALALKSG